MFENLKKYKNSVAIECEKNKKFTLVTGIANAEPLLNYLDVLGLHYEHLEFPDHHKFTVFDIEKLKGTFESIKNQNKIIITTEKDAARLQDPSILPLINELPLFYISIEIDFHGKDKEVFDNYILSYVGRN